MSIPDTTLRSLTDAWLDGTISQEEAHDLEHLLLADPAARRYFFDAVELEVALPTAAAKSPRVAPLPVRNAFPWWKAAAVFMIGAFAGAMIWQVRPSPTQATVSRAPAVARVTGMLGISWGDATGLHALNPGVDTEVQSGLVELTFASGARAVLEGPASFQVVDDNSMRLSFGKIVAEVPKEATGFTIVYAGGDIVDIGTEFALEVPKSGRAANFGVFRGEIEYRPEGDAGRMVRLLENHAVVADGKTLTSVPFDRAKFTRQLPSREFAWDINASSAQPAAWEYDVSHLIWKPGRYRAICKWMQGNHGLAIQGAELMLDGRAVAID
ncbi:MAG TPA: hypothetical protein VF258_10525, partial [Luteolibacter sp.]